ncbi:uncharacterized protein LOC119743162 [Patiria miniata]|uniref:Uncharacterized protein n=1 Tax=Patiria miniata TaxID=46514 RepID=A0A914BHW9_PATMI|nr:uncharacterized protein LOC119743162 [Patiria miniata]
MPVSQKLVCPLPYDVVAMLGHATFSRFVVEERVVSLLVRWFQCVRRQLDFLKNLKNCKTFMVRSWFNRSRGNKLDEYILKMPLGIVTVYGCDWKEEQISNV